MTLDARVVNEVIERAVATARQLPPIRAVALVGSCAAGRARPDSDVDLVFLVTDKASFVEEGWRRFVPRGSRLIPMRC